MERQFFAQLDQNNVVVQVHCVTQEFLEANPDRYSGVWVETFFDTNNKTYAAVNMIYNFDTQDFVGQPFIERDDEQ
jgi:hypothetical protein